MRISDWSSDVCSSDLSLSGEPLPFPIISTNVSPEGTGIQPCVDFGAAEPRAAPKLAQATAKLVFAGENFTVLCRINSTGNIQHPEHIFTQRQLHSGNKLFDLQIGRAHVCTPVTNAHLVCRLLLDKKNIIYIF